MVTVIIPVYNVQQYLARCVDSVLEQSHHDLEIILVDDGSTDASGTLCDQYAARDHRVKVVHKSNGGLSSARNAGLDVMTGSTVTFIDSDDYVHPAYIATLMRHHHLAPIVIGTWQELNEGDTPAPAATIDGDDAQLLSRDEALSRIYYQQDINHSACCKLFDASLFSTLRFPEGMIYEDLAISYDLFKQVDTVVSLHTQPIYYYMHRQGSIINTMTLERTQVLDHLEKIEQEVSTQAPHLLPAVRSRHMSACFNMLRLMPLNDPQWLPTRNRCWEYVKNMRFLCIKDPKVRLKNKIAILLSFFGLNFLLTIINRR